MRNNILLSQTDVERIQKHVNDPRFAAVWRRTKATADRVVELGTISFPEDTMEVWYVYRNRSIDLAVALLATDDECYAHAIHLVLNELAAQEVDFWQGPHYPNRPRTQIVDGKETLVGELETAQLTMGVAILYDLAYEYLTEDDRALAKQMLRRYSYPLLGASVRFQSQKWVMNHLCVNAVAWLLALIILEDAPHREKCMELAIHSLELWIGNIESDGSYGEGYHYWGYPVNCLFFAMQALGQTYGRHLEHEGRIARCFEWALYHQAGIANERGYDKPVAAAVNFHDCPRFFQMEAPEALLFANITHNPMAQWYMDTFLLSDLSRPDESLHIYWHRADALLLALYRDEQPALPPARAGLVGARCFFDTGYQFLRSGWTMKDDLVFAMQSGGGTRSRSHEHHDRNSFMLWAGGELFIADPGHSCYRGKVHNTYDTQTVAHSTWTLDGASQRLEYLEMGMLATEARDYPSYRNAAVPAQQLHPQISMMTSQARRCYEPAWKDYTRRAFMVYGEYILLMDSIDTNGQQGKLSCPLTINTRDGQTVIAQNGNEMRISRPQKELYLAVASRDQAIALDWEEGRLHDAYHIHPDQKVEGRLGSAKRLVLSADAAKVESVMLLCPLDANQETPMFETAFEDDGIRVKISVGGKRDQFVISGQDIAFERENGARYTF